MIGWLTYHRSVISHRAIAERFAFWHRLLVNKYYLDDIAQWVIDKIVLVLGAVVAWFDRVFVNDVGVNGSAFSVMLSALRIRLVQTGRMYNYGMAMALGVVVLVLVWWLTVA